MRIKGWFILVLLAAIIPTPVYANMYVPSFVQIVASPLLGSFYIIPMIVTVPLLFIIAFLEALILRKYAKEVEFWRLIGNLFALNAITSIIGVIITPNGTEIYPGIVIAFILTILIEALLLKYRYKPMRAYNFKTILGASTNMNALSYTFFALVLIGMIYIPSIGAETPSIKNQLSGKLLIGHFYKGFYVIDFPQQNLTMSDRKTLNLPNFVKQYVLPNDDRIYVLLDNNDMLKLTYSDGHWQQKNVKKPDEVSEVYGISQDEKLFYCRYRDELHLVIYNIDTKKVIYRMPELRARVNGTTAVFSRDSRYAAISGINRLIDLKTGKIRELGDVYDLTFSPIEDKIAWQQDGIITVYDYGSGNKKRINPHGGIEFSSSLCWSPDGKYLAYIGYANNLTYQTWTPDIRVIEVATGRSVTVKKRIFTGGAPCRLIWLP